MLQVHHTHVCSMPSWAATRLHLLGTSRQGSCKYRYQVTRMNYSTVISETQTAERLNRAVFLKVPLVVLQ